MPGVLANSIRFDKLDQAKLACQSAPGVSSLIVEAATAHILPVDGCLVTNEMRVELLALLQDFFAPGLAHQLGITEEALITTCLLNKKGRWHAGDFDARAALVKTPTLLRVEFLQLAEDQGMRWLASLNTENVRSKMS